VAGSLTVCRLANRLPPAWADLRRPAHVPCPAPAGTRWPASAQRGVPQGCQHTHVAVACPVAGQHQLPPAAVAAAKLHLGRAD
jgi:hypothetical protein